MGEMKPYSPSPVLPYHLGCQLHRSRLVRKRELKIYPARRRHLVLRMDGNPVFTYVQQRNRSIFGGGEGNRGLGRNVGSLAFAALLRQQTPGRFQAFVGSL